MGGRRFEYGCSVLPLAADMPHQNRVPSITPPVYVCISAEYLHTLNKTQLRLLRNGVYAQYGRPFKDKILQKFFYNSYYASYKENKNYSDAMLTELDKRNIALIKNEERTR